VNAIRTDRGCSQAAIFFAFEFHGKRIVAILAGREVQKALSNKQHHWGKEMQPSRSPACAKPDCSVKRSAGAVFRSCLAVSALVALTGCEQNGFVPPPPPKVDVGVPLQRSVTRYLEATGNTAPIKSVDLVARVQGFLQSIDYKDGALVKEGATLFTIEPETYKLKLEQAQAAEAGAQASVKQAEADYKRQVDLVARQAVSQATLDTSTSSRDNAQANLQQAQANTKIAAVNYGYTTVTAPFDGIVSAHLVSIGELVGVSSPTPLANIVQLDPIYVTFNVNEQDVLRIRAEAKRRGMTSSELTQLPIEVGLQTEEGFPHKGNLDYAAPTINQSTGTLPVRGVLPNPDRVLLPGYYVRVRVPFDQQEKALLVPDVALGSDQSGRYVLVVNSDNVVEQRKVETGPVEGALRVIESGLKPDDRVVIAGLLRAIPGEKVDPQLQKIEAPPAPAKEASPASAK
jgi:RND family efflux transporter MFP subunit